MNQLDINKALAGLTEEERKAALEILGQLASEGSSTLLDDLKFSDFDEIPVDIDTFLDDDKYLGKGLWEVDPITSERKCTFFPYWRETLHKIFPDNLTTAYNTLILTGAIGLGKAETLDSLVLCEHGYKRMGDLQLTDRVFGEDGKLHNILGIFPQGIRPVCRVTFTDNTFVDCDENHLWTVYNTKNQVWTTIETKQLIDGSRNLAHAWGHRYKIPMTKPVQFAKQLHDIHPYVLGVLIGDGCLSNSSVQFASNDDEIVSNVATLIDDEHEVAKLTGKFVYSIRQVYHNKPCSVQYPALIKQFGLNTRAENKHIPESYLLSSVEDRIALLQGLMDTDGYISKDGALIEFTTVSSQLRDDFIFLVQSLGGTCHIRIKHPFYRDKNGNKIYGQISYNIGIKLPKSIPPFKLTRKLNRLNSKALEPFRYIKSIERIHEAECQCIYIDNPSHLYLTNNCIVTHNTLIAVVAQLYQLYRMLCLKDPYAYYGLQPIDKITFSMLNVTLEAAKGVGWSKEQSLVQLSPWFLSHGWVNASRTEPTWQPNKNIEVIFGSSNRHVVGRALFNNLSDEVNFGVGNNVEKQKAKLKKMISQIDARMISRFMKGEYLPTLNIIISSKDTEQSFLDSYIQTKRENESKTTLIIDEPQWVVRPDKGTPDDPGAFYVAVGNKFLAHELLPVDFPESEVDKYRDKGYTMMKVPPGFRGAFEDNLDGALTDIAGISVTSTTRYISGVRLNQTKTDEYLNPFTKDVIECGDGEQDFDQYSKWFDLSRVNPTDLARPMFIHLDMSSGQKGKGDKTGIAGVWITGKRPKRDDQDASKELQYKVAFSVSIKAPKGFNISFEKNRTFIRWLRSQGFAIKGISADTYQSTSTLQLLKADGFNTQIVSVDRVDSDHVCKPYFDFKSAIYERRLLLYRKCDLLTEELVNLERLSSGKVDHPEKGSKDQSDAVCGAMFLASKFAEQYSYDYGENLTTTLDTNLDASDEFNKRQMMLAFEQELTKVALAQFTDSSRTAEQQEEYTYYQNMMDGIIII